MAPHHVGLHEDRQGHPWVLPQNSVGTRLKHVSLEPTLAAQHWLGSCVPTCPHCPGPNYVECPACCGVEPLYFLVCPSCHIHLLDWWSVPHSPLTSNVHNDYVLKPLLHGLFDGPLAIIRPCHAWAYYTPTRSCFVPLLGAMGIVHSITVYCHHSQNVIDRQFYCCQFRPGTGDAKTNKCLCLGICKEDISSLAFKNTPMLFTPAPLHICMYITPAIQLFLMTYNPDQPLLLSSFMFILSTITPFPACMMLLYQCYVTEATCSLCPFTYL